MIKASEKNFCGKKQCNFATLKVSDLEQHLRTCNGVPDFNLFCCIHCRFRFPDKEELTMHLQNCPVDKSSSIDKDKNLHFKTIVKMNRSTTEDHIIQPGPDLLPNQYIRRRPYTKQHKNIWTVSIEKYKYVKCIFQNCHFIAMSLEDMISHFGYCNGDSSFAKHICPYCKGGVTSEEILAKHIERSHTSSSNTKETPKTISNGDRAEQSNFSEDAEVDEPEIMEVDSNNKTESNKVEEQIETGYYYCLKTPCNFMAEKFSDLETHMKTCDGVPNFESFSCSECYNRLLNEEELNKHTSKCKGERLWKPSITIQKVYSKKKSDEVKETKQRSSNQVTNKVVHPKAQKKASSPEPTKQNEMTIPFEPEISIIESPTPKKRGRKQKSFELPEPKESDKPTPKKRGRKSKNVVPVETPSDVSCGKCDFKGSEKNFEAHNLRVHTGLGWIQGQKPIELTDEKELTKLVKPAFKLFKKGTCEICQDVKRSVLGFVTHILNCGKSEEEREALKVRCPHCSVKYLKYSLKVHIKICHLVVTEKEKVESEGEEEGEGQVGECLSGKRKSALRAASKFQEALTEEEDKIGLEKTKELFYSIFKKTDEKVPRLCFKLANAWYRLKKKNQKIPCEHNGCQHKSTEVKEAKRHHFRCPLLPEVVYFCQLCDFYSIEEETIKNHIITHKSYSKKMKRTLEGIKCEPDDEEEVLEADLEEETEDDSKMDSDSPKKRKRKLDEGKGKKAKTWLQGTFEPYDDFNMKQIFSRRTGIEALRGAQFYSCGLRMTLEKETSDVVEDWSELHTEVKDWSQASIKEAKKSLPELAESISIAFTKTSEDEVRWRRFKRFEGCLVNDTPVMFTGGSVQSLSWCKISFQRMLQKSIRQYLALTTSKNFDHFTNIFERPDVPESSLIQIWDCGELSYSLADRPPKFSLGIIQNGGRIWDLSWFPQDCSAEGHNGFLPRLGLLATASEDGIVRIWSICNPNELPKSDGLSIYKTEPVVKLVTDADLVDSCLRVAVGRNGVVAGGYANGSLAIWNLHNVSSPFTKKERKCMVLKPHLTIQAHRASIIALTFRPDNSRYLATSGLDRFIKTWDLECPSMALEIYSRELTLDLVWTRNWPMIIYNFDEVSLTQTNKFVARFVKDIFSEKHQCCITAENPCLNASFNDWLNAACGCTNTGEIKVKFMKNFIHEQKLSESTQSTISSARLEKLIKTETDEVESKKGKEADDKIDLSGQPKTYDEANLKFGLVINDAVDKGKSKGKAKAAHPEKIPVAAINKVLFNPNIKTFNHIAVGYNCGLVRIQYLKEMKDNRTVKSFLEKAEKQKF